jgi:hypothetical protein
LFRQKQKAGLPSVTPLFHSNRRIGIHLLVIKRWGLSVVMRKWLGLNTAKG